MINKENTLSIDKICRSCMEEGNEMKSVYDTNTESSVQLAEMIMACASVQVASGDGLPTLICPKCEEHLNIAYVFKQQCEKTDATLRELTTPTNHSSLNSIKEESLDIIVKPDIDVLYDEDTDRRDDNDNDADNDEPYNTDSESDQSNYSAKLRRKKKSSKSRQCRFCSKMLSTKEGLRLHERRHTGEKLKTCPVCQATFAKSNHLMRHMSSHNKPTDEYKHTCQECGMGFTKASHLQKHLREHKSDDKDSKNESSSTIEDSIMDQDKSDSQNESFDTMVKTEIDSDENEAGSSSGMTTRPKLRPKREPIDIDKLHPCKVCNKILTTAPGLKIHMRRHTGINLSTCYICLKSFTKLNHLNRHMLTHGISSNKSSVKEKSNEPKEKKYMACEFCDRKFVYKKSFLHHIQMEHQISEDSDTPLSEYATIITKTKSEPTNSENGGEQNPEDRPPGEESFEDFMQEEEAKKIHACHVCNHKFTRANHLTRHMTLHRAVLIHKCDRCEKAFMTEEHLATHVQEYHVDRPYVCSLCNKPFSRGEHLIRHLKVHDKESTTTDAHKCSICEKVFSRSDHLARHTKLHLAQDKRHVCGECGKAFNRLDNLRTHSRIHTGVRDPQRLHLCIYCGKEFNNSSNMIVHMRRHTGERPYKCGQCGKGFPRSHDLKCHERTHSGEKPYLCTLCGKSFNKSNKLLRHTRVHTGERPYVCSLCGRAFTQSNDLALHMRRHTGSRPYACGMCPARFIQSGQLKAHRRSQGHWLETQPELKGAHRVTPVTPLVNPPPIKFKTRVQRIKEEPTILGHTIGVGMNVGSLAGVVAAAVQAAAQQVVNKEQELVTRNSNDGSIIPSSSGNDNVTSPFYVAREQQKDLKMEDSVHNFSVTNLSRDTAASSGATPTPQFQQGPSVSVDPGTSFSSNITITSPTFAVSEAYNTYQTYG